MFTDEYGVQYSDDKKTLKHCPRDFKGEYIIPNSVTTIGESAFRSCSGLTSPVYNANCFAYMPTSYKGAYTIPDGIKQIAGGAFYGCSGLTSITIPNSVKTIEESAFYDCSSLKKTNYTGTIADWCKIMFSIYDGDISSNPMCYSRNFFINDVEVKDLVIPQGVDLIGNGAFYGCSGLTSVTIPNSVTTIGESAFRSCSGLTSITIPNSVTTIGESAFEDCDGLKKTNYTGTIADWCKIKFSNYYSNPMCYSHNFCINDVEVKDLVIPEGVDTIGDYAFSSCSGLTSVTISNSVTTIGESAFARCDGLTSVTIPNSVTTIGSYAFYTVNNIVYSGTASGSPWGAKCVNGYVDGCLVYSDAAKTTLCGCSSAATGEIIIPTSVTTIGDCAFDGCRGLTSVTIPNSVTTIGNYAFDGCSGLMSIVVERGNIYFDSRDNCNAIIKTASNKLIVGCKNTIIPNSVTEIGEKAFEGCIGLTSVTIPNSVTSIGLAAFRSCSGLTSVTIPNSVTSIGWAAFYGCTGLTSINIPNSVTTI